MPEAVPRVSVLLPVYNGGPYLADAVASVRAQTLADFELVAVDDGSTDGSGALLDGAAAADPRLRVLHQPNRGLVAALNRGLAEARAPLVARMDADDLSAPERLEKQVRFLDAHPGVGVVGSYADKINDDGASVGTWRVLTTDGELRWRLYFGNAIVHPSVVMRRALVEAAGGYDPAALHAEDYALWVALAARTRLANLPEALVLKREHGERVTRKHADVQEQTVVRIAQRHMAGLVRYTPSEGSIALLRYATQAERRPSAAPPPGPDGRDLRAAAALAADLGRAFLRAHALTPADAAHVRASVGLKLRALARAAGAPAGWPLVLRSALWSASGPLTRRAGAPSPAGGP